MVIKDDAIDIASAGIQSYKSYRNMKKFLFVSLSVLFFIVALVLFFMDFVFLGVVLVVLSLIAFAISRFFAFTSKILETGLEKLQQYKDGEIYSKEIQKS